MPKDRHLKLMGQDEGVSPRLIMLVEFYTTPIKRTLYLGIAKAMTNTI